MFDQFIENFLNVLFIILKNFIYRKLKKNVFVYKKNLEFLIYIKFLKYFV